MLKPQSQKLGGAPLNNAKRNSLSKINISMLLARVTTKLAHSKSVEKIDLFLVCNGVPWVLQLRDVSFCSNNQNL
jgi:hypothetical protein